MSKAILEFVIPEEEHEFKTAINAMAYRTVVEEMDGKLRSWLKYGNEFKTVEEAIQETRNYLLALTNDINVE